MYLVDLINKKWKLSKEKDVGLTYYVNNNEAKHMAFYELYEKINMSYYKKFANSYNIVFLPELLDFYKAYNGCKLFYDSISIYGIKINGNGPFDLFLNDRNRHGDIKTKISNINSKDLELPDGVTRKDFDNCIDVLLDDIVFFGCVGKYNMYYKQSEISNPKIYLSYEEGITPIKTFNSIKEVFEFYIPKLYEEYDENGTKAHQNDDELSRLAPRFKNQFYGDFDWQ